VSKNLIQKVTSLPGINSPSELRLEKSFAGNHRVFFVTGYWWDNIHRPVFTSPTGQPTKYHGKWTFIKIHAPDSEVENIIIEVPWANRIAGKMFANGNPDPKPLVRLASGQPGYLPGPKS